MSTIQHMLRPWRERSGLSQSQIARDLDITAAHISRMEAAKTGVTLDVLERYLKAVGCRLAIVPEAAATPQEVAASAVQLTPRQLAIVSRLVSVLPQLPDLLVDELERQVEGWAARFDGDSE